MLQRVLKTDILCVGRQSIGVLQRLDRQYPHLGLTRVYVGDVVPNKKIHGSSGILLDHYPKLRHSQTLGPSGLKIVDTFRRLAQFGNGQLVQYRYFIGAPHSDDWKDNELSRNLISQARQKSTKVFTDTTWSDPTEFIASQLGNKVVIIPQYPHAALDSFFMLDKLIPLQPRINLTILNCNKSLLMENHSQVQTALSNIISQIPNVKLINQCESINIHYKNKLIETAQGQIKFDTLFHFAPIRNPIMLKSSTTENNSKSVEKVHNKNSLYIVPSYHNSTILKVVCLQMATQIAHDYLKTDNPQNNETTTKQAEKQYLNHRISDLSKLIKPISRDMSPRLAFSLIVKFIRQQRQAFHQF